VACHPAQAWSLSGAKSSCCSRMARLKDQSECPHRSGPGQALQHAARLPAQDALHGLRCLRGQHHAVVVGVPSARRRRLRRDVCRRVRHAGEGRGRGPPRWASHHPTASAAAQPAPRERRWGSEGRPSCTTEQARLRQIAQAAAVRAHARHRRSRAWLPGQSCAEQPRMPSCLVKPEMLPALQSRALHIEGVSTHSDFWAH